MNTEFLFRVVKKPNLREMLDRLFGLQPKKVGEESKGRKKSSEVEVMEVWVPIIKSCFGLLKNRSEE